MGACSAKVLTAEDMRERFLLNTKAQSKALKRFVEVLDIPSSLIDKIYGATRNSDMDVGSALTSKKEFLNQIDMTPTPFAIGALNTLSLEEKSEFFQFFAAVYHYNIFDQDDLVAHTFALADENGNGRLSIEELTVLVHYVYGTHVAKSEVGGMIVTTNRTDIQTANTVMKNLDRSGSGSVTLPMFQQGIRKHGNLLSPAFNTQQHLRRACGGRTVWKKERRRLEKHCQAKRLQVPKVYGDILRALHAVESGKGASLAKKQSAASRGGSGRGSVETAEESGGQSFVDPFEAAGSVDWMRDDDDDGGDGGDRSTPAPTNRIAVKAGGRGGFRGTDHDLNGDEREPGGVTKLGKGWQNSLGAVSAGHAFAHKSGALKKKVDSPPSNGLTRRKSAGSFNEEEGARRGSGGGGTGGGGTGGMNAKLKQGGKWGAARGAVDGTTSFRSAGQTKKTRTQELEQNLEDQRQQKKKAQAHEKTKRGQVRPLNPVQGMYGN
mmetsp:Transcript_10952/g.21902  ORF Transcript_10952/g.21902 Transcript_10952/m.21902 type:complete len:492 (+) Transcript_10952:97-1572(+)